MYSFAMRRKKFVEYHNSNTPEEMDIRKTKFPGNSQYIDQNPNCYK